MQSAPPLVGSTGSAQAPRPVLLRADPAPDDGARAPFACPRTWLVVRGQALRLIEGTIRFQREEGFFSDVRLMQRIRAIWPVPWTKPQFPVALGQHSRSGPATAPTVRSGARRRPGPPAGIAAGRSS